MKIGPLINLAVLILVAALAYAATLHFDRQAPNIQTAPESVLKPVANNQPVPAFTFTDANGKTHNIQDFAGKTIILNFWASWCAPCIKELPHFIKAAKANPDTLVFIGLSSDIDEATMLRFLDKLGEGQNLNLPQQNVVFALDSKNITADLFQTFRLPETILIDKDQIMRTKIIGADWDYKELSTKIKSLQ